MRDAQFLTVGESDPVGGLISILEDGLAALRTIRFRGLRPAF